MDILVRLYKIHDYDLIYLYKNLRFPIRDAVVSSLKSYVRKEPEFISFPINNIEDDKDKLVNIRNTSFHVILDDESDKDIIDFLDGLKKSFRNSFIKNTLRGYLTGPATYVYQETIDVEDTKKQDEIIKSNIMGIKSLPLLKERKDRTKYLHLTKKQKDLLEKGNILNGDEKIKIIPDKFDKE